MILYRLIIFIQILSIIYGFKISTCSSGYYFDIGSFQCVSCGTGQNSTTDGFGCKCSSGYSTLYVEGGTTPSTKISCTDCYSNSKAPTSDGLNCLPCDSSTSTLSSDLKLCICSDVSKHIVSYDSTGSLLSSQQCVTCPSGSYQNSANPFQCIKCDSTSGLVYDSNVGTCVCASGTQSVALPTSLYNLKSVLEGDPAFVDSFYMGFVCLSTTSMSSIASKHPSFSTVDFRNVYDIQKSAERTLPLSSFLLTKVFSMSSVQCSGGDAEACQLLGNLCALHYFSLDSAPCKEYMTLYSTYATITNGFSDWPSLLPYLYHTNVAGTIYSTDITSSFLFQLPEDSSSDLLDKLRIILAKYALNGTFLGYERLSTQFQLCGEGSLQEKTAWLNFGTSFHQKCTIDIATLSQKATVFYDVFFVDKINSSPYSLTLQPVPIQIYNSKDASGGYPNTNTNELDNILVHRFWLVDGILGTTNSFNNNPTVCRYAKSLKIKTQIQKDTTSRIYPPLISVEYGEILCTDLFTTTNVADELATLVSDAESSYSPDVTFDVSYVTDLTSLWSFVNIVFWVLSVLAIVFVILKVYFFNRQYDAKFVFNLANEKSSSGATSFSSILLHKTLNEVLHVFSTLFFGFSVAISLYFFVFFKLQDTVYLLLPFDDDMSFFTTLSYLCLIFIVLAKIHDFYIFGQMRVLFVDYDLEVNDLQLENTTKGGKDAEEEEEEENDTVIHGEKGRNEQNNIGGNVWRKLTMCDQWVSLQGMREYPIFMVILIVSYILKNSIGFSYPTPKTTAANSLLSAESSHPILLFFLVFVIFLFIVILAVLFNGLIKKKFIFDEFGYFLDSSCLTSMSLFIFSNHKGIRYLHGRNPAGKADINIFELLNNLRLESNDLITQRNMKFINQSLETSPGQFFEIFLPIDIEKKIINSHLEKIVRLNNEISIQKMEKLEMLEKKLKNILTSLIDDVSSGQKGTFVPSLTFVERMFGYVPELGFMSGNIQEEHKNRSIIFVQRQNDELKSFLPGSDLVGNFIFEVSIFFITFTLWDNIILSAFITLVLVLFSSILHRMIAKRIVAHNSFINHDYLRN
eukprot:TRINITY_DN2261_c0_g1_i1.p1 TRINITY_DN2261_c0_g1~~TRINITY_DN2261_c0_g1_i1.p1  ORF type:complete len:1090 (-),score=238.02 TRINITY_DN2261_c0_g1_i1:73-3312(-)